MADLQVISGDATPEEVAAILAAVAEIERQRALEAAATAPARDPQAVDHWRRTARLAHRRTGMQRGPWRLSGRLTRRSRA